MTPLPLDAYERRADWLAALLVAMVVVPGFAAALPKPASPPRGTAPAAAPVRGVVRAGAVRPPRSC